MGCWRAYIPVVSSTIARNCNVYSLCCIAINCRVVSVSLRDHRACISLGWITARTRQHGQDNTDTGCAGCGRVERTASCEERVHTISPCCRGNQLAKPSVPGDPCDNMYTSKYIRYGRQAEAVHQPFWANTFRNASSITVRVHSSHQYTVLSTRTGWHPAHPVSMPILILHPREMQALLWQNYLAEILLLYIVMQWREFQFSRRCCFAWSRLDRNFFFTHFLKGCVKCRTLIIITGKRGAGKGKQGQAKSEVKPSVLLGLPCPGCWAPAAAAAACCRRFLLN